MTTGFLGTRPLLPALSANGHHDLAGILMQQKEYPSWGYEVENGATTIWELWNGDTANPAMNSANHVMLLGDLITWLHEDLAGIERVVVLIERRPDASHDLAKVPEALAGASVVAPYSKAMILSWIMAPFFYLKFQLITHPLFFKLF